MKTLLLLISLASAQISSATDDALRAFLGLSAASATLKDMKIETPYVAAIARFEKGHFLGYDRISNGLLSPSDVTHGKFEIIWGKKNNEYGYAFVCGSSSFDYKKDSIFEHLTSMSTSWTSMNDLDRLPDFRSMKILTSAESSSIAGDSFTKADYSVLILFKKFTNLKETIDFMRTLKSSQQDVDDIPPLAPLVLDASVTLSWTVAAKLLGMEANTEVFDKASAVYGSATLIQTGDQKTLDFEAAGIALRFVRGRVAEVEFQIAPGKAIRDTAYKGTLPDGVLAARISPDQALKVLGEPSSESTGGYKKLTYVLPECLMALCCGPQLDYVILTKKQTEQTEAAKDPERPR